MLCVVHTMSKLRWLLISAVSMSISVVVDSKEELIPLGVYGLGPNSVLSCSVQPDHSVNLESSIELPRSVLFLTPLQERLYWTSNTEGSSTTSGPIDVARPVYARVYLDDQKDTSDFTVQGVSDSALLLNVYLHNPQRFRDNTLRNRLFSSDNTTDERRRYVGKIKFDVENGQFQYRYLPNSMGYMAISVLVLIGIYEGLMLTIWRQAVSQIHIMYMVSGLILSGFFYLTSISEARQGLLGLASEYAEKIFDAVELGIYMLTAVGYKVVRRNLTRTEWRILVSLIVAMIYIGFFEVDCEVECGGYRLGRVIISAVAFLIVIIGVNFHLATLSSQVPESALNVVGKLYQKREAYENFRKIFLLYIVLPSFAIYYRVAVLDWTDDWAFISFFWIGRAALLLSLFWVFRPRITNMKVFDLVTPFRR